MNNKLLFPALFLALGLTITGVSHNKEAARLIAASEQVEVQIGDSITVEPRTLIHNGESKVSKGQIIYPDGSSKSGRAFTISMPGAYQVIYSAFFGVEEEREVVTYMCNRDSGSFFASNDPNNLAVAGEYSHNAFGVELQGAVLNLKRNASFTFDQIIDFSSFGSNKPFLEFIVDPVTQTEADIESFIVRLSDVDDNDNYVDISVTDSTLINDDGEGCYILAGANNQFKTGYEKWGGSYLLHIATFGTNVHSSFRALPVASPTNTAKLFFDYEQRALYVENIHGWNIRSIITDLDDPKVYGGTIWNGFKNGRARLSILSKTMIADSGKLMILKAGDMDLSQLKFDDKIGPTINIDYQGQVATNIPKATVGRHYNIFPAIVNDNYDHELTYQVNVTFNDEEAHKTRDISVINNTFVPQKEGTYTITYQARDYSNNRSQKTVKVVAINDSQSMTISLPSTSMSQPTFSTFHLPSISDVSVNGGSGNPTIVRRLVDKNDQEIALEGDTFIPTEPGEYRLFFNATDYIGNVATTKMTITAEELVSPIFIGENFLPRVLVKGNVYTLSNYQGAETVNGKTVYLDSTISVNGTVLTDNTFTASNECHITYTITGTTGSNTHDVSIPVIDGHGGEQQVPYFYGNFDDVVENQENVTLKTSHDSSLLFAGILPYDNPLISMNRDFDYANYQSLSIKFSEVYNPNKSLTFNVRFDGEKVFASQLNSAYEQEMECDVFESKQTVTLSFNNSTGVLIDGNYTELFSVKKFDNGSLFTGFSSGIYLDISMNGVTSLSTLEIVTIANQNFGHFDLYMDTSAPILIFKDKFIIEQSINADAIVPTVDVFDVLGNASVLVNVKAPDGTFILKNQDGRYPLNFKLNQYGNYILTYQVSDDYGNSVNYPRKIVVFDDVPPVLNVNNNLKETYKLNAAVKIPDYTASDNLGIYTVYVLLLLPNNEERLLLKDESGKVTSYLSLDSPIYNPSFKVSDRTFRVEQYGRYTLRYMIFDDAFNVLTQEYHFTVK